MVDVETGINGQTYEEFRSQVDRDLYGKKPLEPKAPLPRKAPAVNRRRK